jgi:hypothetical protein
VFMYRRSIVTARMLRRAGPASPVSRVGTVRRRRFLLDYARERVFL